MTARFEIRAPSINHSGHPTVLLQWTVQEGDLVEPETPIGLLISAAGVSTLMTDRVGVIEDLMILAGAPIEPGEIVAVLTPPPATS